MPPSPCILDHPLADVISRHACSCHSWHASLPQIGALEQLWLALERLTAQRVRTVRAAAAATGGATAPSAHADGLGGRSGAVELAHTLHAALARRQRMRSAWAQRARDPIFADLDEGYVTALPTARDRTLHPREIALPHARGHIMAKDGICAETRRAARGRGWRRYRPLPCLHEAAEHVGTLPAELSEVVDELEALLQRATNAAGGAKHGAKRKQLAGRT
jgi:hypothetical protein